MKVSFEISGFHFIADVVEDSGKFNASIDIPVISKKISPDGTQEYTNILGCGNTPIEALQKLKARIEDFK